VAGRCDDLNPFRNTDPFCSIRSLQDCFQLTSVFAVGLRSILRCIEDGLLRNLGESQRLYRV
jgi:hypothetical protein